MPGTQELINASRLSFYDNKPTAYLVQTGTQSLTSGTYTAISFNTATGDTWNAWSAGAPTLYTVQVPGLYALSGIVAFAANATGSRFAVVYYNGVAVQGAQSQVPTIGTDFYSICTPKIHQRASAGDTFALYGAQSSGGALSTAVSGGLASSFTVEYVRS